MATSLAILPSAPLQTSLPTQSPISRRPKLSLNTTQTSQSRSFGKGASLRLDTLSAVSPTARNTFSNAYETPAPTAGRPSLRLDTSNDSSEVTEGTLNKYTAQRHDSATASSASSTDSITTPPPYKLSHSIPSILSNSPYPSLKPRKMSTRPFFPTIKKVSFREPLVEEITTTIYTAKHSDLESTTKPASSSETVVDMSTAAEGATFAKRNQTVSPPPTLQCLSPTSSITGKRDSSDSEGEESCAQTPIAGRRKRMRDWRWTLDPVDKPSSTLDETVTSHQSS